MREIRALRILEFPAIRDRLASQCQTALSRSNALELTPDFEEPKVWKLLDQTREAYDLLGTAPPPSLYGVADCRDSLKRAAKGGMLGGQELHQIGTALGAIRAMKDHLEHQEKPNLKDISIGLCPEQKVEQELLYCLDGDGTIVDDATPTLANIRSRKKGAHARIIERITSYTTGRLREYLSDPIYTVREGRYVVPVKAEHKGKIKGIVHDSSATGSTFFIEPDDVIAATNQARQIDAEEREEEKAILTMLSRKVAHIAEATSGSLVHLAELDLIFSKARLAAEMKAALPIRKGGNFIRIQGGKHPLLDPMKVVPLDIQVGQGNSVLITGPNTGGKTVSIKTVGLFVAMLQCGMLPPALHVEFGHFTQLWADIGDEQSIEQSLSTFSGHLKNIASALNNLQPGALVLLDEAGAGTDPAEGAALARAILEEFALRGATLLASTHYGELKAFAFEAEGFQNASMEFDQKSLRPTYRLILGAAGASQALKIAEKYGIAPHIVERAKAGLSEQAQDIAAMLQQLENSQKQARAAQSEADRRAAELKELEAKAERKLKEAEDIRKRANERAHDAIESSLREIRIQSDDIFDRLKKYGGNPEATQRAKKDLQALDSLGKDLSKKFKSEQKPTTTQAQLKKGDTVQVLGFQQNGILLDEPTGREVHVQIGAIRMKVDIRKLIPVENPKPKATSRGKVNIEKTFNVTTEITLRNQRAEEAIRILEKFIDEAILGNAPFVRIVHGKGEGILRQITQDYLKQHRDVKSYRDGDPTEGGQGVTIANFA
jgi:DNA mismatch repair protein MutS2